MAIYFLHASSIKPKHECERSITTFFSMLEQYRHRCLYMMCFSHISEHIHSVPNFLQIVPAAPLEPVPVMAPLF